MAESYNIPAQAARWGGRRFGAEIKFKWIQKFLILITLGNVIVYERWKWPQNITLGYSSLKSLEILGVHSRRAKIFAAISFPWKYENHQVFSGSRIFKALICYKHSHSSTAFDLELFPIGIQICGWFSRWIWTRFEPCNWMLCFIDEPYKV